MSHEHCILPDSLRCLEGDGSGSVTGLVLQPDTVTIAVAEFRGLVLIDPQFVLGIQITENRRILRSRERMDGTPPIEQPELPGRGLVSWFVYGNRVETGLIQFERGQLDLP